MKKRMFSIVLALCMTASYCQTTGVISGRTGGMFAPKETATRAEVAAITERFVESVVK